MFILEQNLPLQGHFEGGGGAYQSLVIVDQLQKPTRVKMHNSVVPSHCRGMTSPAKTKQGRQALGLLCKMLL